MSQVADEGGSCIVHVRRGPIRAARESMVIALIPVAREAVVIRPDPRLVNGCDPRRSPSPVTLW